MVPTTGARLPPALIACALLIFAMALLAACRTAARRPVPPFVSKGATK